jgi:hypothetical protein
MVRGNEVSATLIRLHAVRKIGRICYKSYWQINRIIIAASRKCISLLVSTIKPKWVSSSRLLELATEHLGLFVPTLKSKTAVDCVNLIMMIPKSIKKRLGIYGEIRMSIYNLSRCWRRTMRGIPSLLNSEALDVK